MRIILKDNELPSQIVVECIAETTAHQDDYLDSLAPPGELTKATYRMTIVTAKRLNEKELEVVLFLAKDPPVEGSIV
jgi:hypothetical protein